MEALEVISPEFWRKKRVLVTGLTGFKGSWLGLWLHSLGAHVFGVSLEPPQEPNLYKLAVARLAKQTHPKLKRGDGSLVSHQLDIREYAPLQKCFTECHPDVVLHLAAQSLVLQSYQDPLSTYSTNVMGTVNVLEAVRHTKSVKVAVIVTSDKCYAPRESSKPYREDDPMGGLDPYSSSKGCAELITAAYRHSLISTEYHRRIGLATVRAGNVVGGGDWASDRLVPDCIRSFAHSTPVRVRSPQSTRPWQHVLEPLHGYLMLAQRLWTECEQFSRSWNFGPSPADVWPVSKVVERLATLWGTGASWNIGESNQHTPEAGILAIDSSLAHRELSWSPKLNVAEALGWTVDWYHEWVKGGDLHDMTMAQILEYQRLI